MSDGIDWTNSCLPEDCLLIIHQKLQNHDDRDAFGLTCKRWLQIQNIARTQLVLDFAFNPRRQVQEYPQYIQRLLIRFPYLSKLSLGGCTDLPDSALTPLVVSCASLRYLSLYNCFNITDYGLIPVFTGCRNLETLNLSRCNITDAGLYTIAGSCHILKNINLFRCSNISDHGLNALCIGCPKLNALIITSCNITGIGLKDSPPSLTYLEAENCILSSEGVCQTVKGGGLEYLNLSSPKNLSKHGGQLGYIGSGYAQRLRFLNLRLCRQMSDESASAIAKGCPMLEEWNLAICHGVRLLGWLAIGSNCKKLRVLHVNRCRNLNNQGLNALRDGCDQLEVLYIHGCKGVTETGLEIFKMHRFNVEFRKEECVTMLIGPSLARLFL